MTAARRVQKIAPAPTDCCTSLTFKPGVSMSRLFQRKRMTTSLLAALVGLPVILSTVVQFSGTEIQAVEDPVPPPALVFQQYMIRPYLPEPQAVVSARFRFMNRSDRVVEIGEIERSCGCLGKQMRKTRIEPGERGELMLQVQTANETAGPKEFYAVVHYKDPYPRTARLTFKFNIPEDKVSVEPKALLFYQFGSDTSSREITVRDYRPRKLELTDIRCSSKMASIGPVTTDNEDDYREYRFNVTVSGNVPPGQHRSVITMFTNDVAYPQIIVPLYIQGPEAANSSVEVDPSEIRLLRKKDTDSTIPIRITASAAESPLTITAAESSPLGLVVELEPTRIEGDKQVVSGHVKLHPDFPEAAERGVVSFHTTDRGRPRIDIPVKVEAVDE